MLRTLRIATQSYERHKIGSDMLDPILESLIRLLRYQRAPKEFTAQFRKMKHDADLLPRLQNQLQVLLDAHGRFREVIYDTQGIHDDGADLVVRIPPSDENQVSGIIGFQVKSFDDLTDKSYLQILKAQRHDAFQKIAGLQYYFIVVCADMMTDAKKLRSINAAFKTASQTEIIEPGFVITFMNHPATRIDALVKRMMEAKDIVFKRAQEELANYESPSARALIIFMLATTTFREKDAFFDQERLTSERTLGDIYEELRNRQASLLHEFRGKKEPLRAIEEDRDAGGPLGSDVEDDLDDEYELDNDEPIQLREFNEQLAIDLDEIDTDTIQQSGTDAFQIEAQQFRALTAVITDAVARYDYGRDQVIEYMVDVMGLRD